MPVLTTEEESVRLSVVSGGKLLCSVCSANAGVTSDLTAAGRDPNWTDDY